MSWCSAAPSLPSGQPGARQERASPAPRRAGRGGEERDGDRKGRVAPGGGSHQAGRAPRAGCALQPPRGLGLGDGEGGTRHDIQLNLAQNKQPSAAGENSRPVFQADRETVEPFFLWPRSSSVNPLSPGGSGEPIPGSCWHPWARNFARLACALQGSEVWHCHQVSWFYYVNHRSPWMLWVRDLLPRVLLLSWGWWW